VVKAKVWDSPPCVAAALREAISRKNAADFVIIIFHTRPSVNGHEHVDCNGDPYLGFHRVLRSAEEPLDTKMLLDPFEKSFDEPPTAIQIRNRFCGQLEIVGEEYEMLIADSVEVTNASGLFWVILFGVEAAEGDDLIASKSSRFVDWQGFESMKNQIVLGSDDKSCWRLMHTKKALEVRVGAIHDDASFDLKKGQSKIWSFLTVYRIDRYFQM
jgi:hypothetical protein